MFSAQDKIAIVGLGLTGLSCARYLERQGLRYSVIDSRQQPPGLTELHALNPQVSCHLGDFQDADFAEFDVLVMSPGVDLKEECIQRAIARGARITGDIDLFAQQVEAPVIAVTGSNAKSTVVTLLGAMATEAGVDAVVAGNIGRPVLDLLAEAPRALYILELSSFQLETTEALNARVATILNLSADHMDRYAGLTEYLQAKQRIFIGCEHAVVNRDDARTALPANLLAQVSSFGLDAATDRNYGVLHQQGDLMLAQGERVLMSAQNLGLAGRHNIANALAALALGDAAGLPEISMLKALRAFPGLPHRCQRVANIEGVSYINDSKGTNIGACIAAIEGFAADGPLTLIAGGQGKGADFAQLRPAINAHVSELILIGEDATAIAQAMTDCVHITHCDSLQEAVRCAAALSPVGSVVLLSPACASFDMFRNFQHRGDEFAAIVNALPCEQGGHRHA